MAPGRMYCLLALLIACPLKVSALEQEAMLWLAFRMSSLLSLGHEDKHSAFILCDEYVEIVYDQFVEKA